MKSRKLTVSMKDSIRDSIGKAWDASNPPPEVEVTPRWKIESDFAKDCHNTAYGTIDFKGVSEDFLNKASGIKIKMPDDNIFWPTYRDDEGNREELVSSELPGVKLVLTKESPEYIKYKKALRSMKDATKVLDSHKETKNIFLEQVQQGLDSVNTTKQLLEIWPEIEEHLPNDIRDLSSIQLPSVNFKELNKQL
jgi:hypothetical protein